MTVYIIYNAEGKEVGRTADAKERTALLAAQPEYRFEEIDDPDEDGSTVLPLLTQ